MNLICIGKLVNTHGIKGEVRIISDFKYKSDVFKIGNCLYIDDKWHAPRSGIAPGRTAFALSHAGRRLSCP